MSTKDWKNKEIGSLISEAWGFKFNSLQEFDEFSGTGEIQEEIEEEIEEAYKEEEEEKEISEESTEDMEEEKKEEEDEKEDKDFNNLIEAFAYILTT